MAGYPRKYGLASAIDGFSSGLATGANVGMNLARVGQDNRRAERDEARQRRQDAIGARMDETRMDHLAEQTAGMKDNRQRAAAGQKVEDAAVQAEVAMMSQIYKAREKLRQSSPQQFKELADGMMMAGEIEMNTGESWRAAALVFSEGNLEPIKAVDEQASAGVKKLLSDAFGMDVSKVDDVRMAEDGGLEIVSGGKVVGKVDEFQRVNMMSGMMKQARKHYVSAQATIQEAQTMLQGGDKNSKLHSLGEGRHGLLQEGEGGPVLREIPRVDAQGNPMPGGLAGAAAAGEDGELKDVRVGDEHFTGRVRGGAVEPLQRQEPAPQNVWEAAERLVDSGVKTTARKVSGLNNDRWGAKEGYGLDELVKKARDAKAGSKAKYNAAIKEWIHGYIQDVRNAAHKRAAKESKDGVYPDERAAELVAEQMNLDGVAEFILPYLKNNPQLK